MALCTHVREQGVPLESQNQAALQIHSGVLKSFLGTQPVQAIIMRGWLVMFAMVQPECTSQG